MTAGGGLANKQLNENGQIIQDPHIWLNPILAKKEVVNIELGFEKGSFSHDLLGHEKDILPNDAGKAVLALLKASKLLPEKYADKKEKYLRAANLGFD